MTIGLVAFCLRCGRLWASVRAAACSLLAPAVVIPLSVVRLVRRRHRRARLGRWGSSGHAPRRLRIRPAAIVSSEPSRAPDPAASRRTVAKPEPALSMVRVGADFCPARYATTFAALQRPSSAAVLDLAPARALCADVFERLADDWTASQETVPRLGIVLSFERWVLLRVEALTAVQPIAARGIRVDVLYEEQASRHPVDWLAGEVVHNVAGVVATLTARWQLAPSWRPPPTWPGVLDMIAGLVRVHAGAALPALLIDLAELALSCGDAVRAVVLAREALYYLPAQSRARRSKALCELGTALIEQGEIASGLHMLDDATAMAAAITEPAIGASSLFQSGLYALQTGDYPGAERRFRGALDLLSSSDRRPRLRALVHHHLAIALMRQDKPGAAHHASLALALRPDLGGSVDGRTGAPPTDPVTLVVPEALPASEVKV